MIIIFLITHPIFHFQDIRNTVGNIPMNWYNEYPHVGYDWDANPILKPKAGDSLDNFLRRMEDPNYL